MPSLGFYTISSLKAIAVVVQDLFPSYLHCGTILAARINILLAIAMMNSSVHDRPAKHL
jgi:hypothetical protein